MGWISFASWLLVYSPQIYENYRNKSGEGVSVYFITIWLIGDLANLGGAIRQHLLPTIIILAVYYTICDSIVLFQIFYYRDRRRKDQKLGLILDPSRSNLTIEGPPSSSPEPNSAPDHPTLNHHTESSPLLTSRLNPSPHHETLSSPMMGCPKGLIQRLLDHCSKGWIGYVTVYGLIISIGTIGWSISQSSSHSPSSPISNEQDPSPGSRELWDYSAQIMGWICATAYLGSRLPQILKNRITKCQGLSLLFVIVGITGNATYFSSILIADRSPTHILINLSWLVGSAGTVLLDLIVLYQFWIYRNEAKVSSVLEDNP